MSAPAYTVLRRAPEVLEVRLTPEAIAAACRDHFPGAPIVPGVALLDWGLALAAEAFGTPRAATHLQVKFFRPVRPGMELRLALKCTPARLEILYTADGEPAARGRVTL